MSIFVFFLKAHAINTDPVSRGENENSRASKTCH